MVAEQVERGQRGVEQHAPLVLLSLLFGVHGDDDVTVGKEGPSGLAVGAVWAWSVGRRWASGLPPHGLCVFFYFFFSFLFFFHFCLSFL